MAVIRAYKASYELAVRMMRFAIEHGGAMLYLDHSSHFCMSRLRPEKIDRMVDDWSLIAVYDDQVTAVQILEDLKDAAAERLELWLAIQAPWSTGGKPDYLPERSICRTSTA